MERSVSAASKALSRKCRGVPHIPWVAKWFTAGQAALKFLQLVSCSIAVIVLFTWSKDPSSAFSFDNLLFQDARGSLDFRPHWYFFASVGLFTSSYALLLPAVGFVGLNVWPLARTVLSIFCTLLWLVGGPVMSSAITIMEASRYANENLVDFLMPKVATGFGFLSLGLFVIDVLFALMALREHHTSDKFIQEVVSRSTMLTVQKCMPDAQPPPADTQPGPADAQPAPADAQPPPADTQPAPADAQPPPADTQPAPADAQPPPADAQPPPGDVQPPSADTQLLPADTQLLPADAHPPPTDTQSPSAASPTHSAGSQTPSAGSQPPSPQIELYMSAHSVTLGAEEGQDSKPHNL